jgi:hypothetical protein
VTEPANESKTIESVFVAAFKKVLISSTGFGKEKVFDLLDGKNGRANAAIANRTISDYVFFDDDYRPL